MKKLATILFAIMFLSLPCFAIEEVNLDIDDNESEFPELIEKLFPQFKKNETEEQPGITLYEKITQNG